MKTCFVVCAIGNEGSETRKRSDQLLKHIIEPVCKDFGLEAIRVDKVHDSNSITDTIIRYIKESELVIADITEHNPNAFFEIGFRSALQKPIIHLKSKDDTIPFDISTIRTLDYDLKNLDSVADVKERLSKTISTLNLDSSTDSDSSVEKAPVNIVNSQILQELFNIQDSLNSLNIKIDSLNSKDLEATSLLADKLAATSAKSPESIMFETLLSTALENPNKLENIFEVANKYSKK